MTQEQTCDARAILLKFPSNSSYRRAINSSKHRVANSIGSSDCKSGTISSTWQRRKRKFYERMEDNEYPVRSTPGIVSLEEQEDNGTHTSIPMDDSTWCLRFVCKPWSPSRCPSRGCFSSVSDTRHGNVIPSSVALKRRNPRGERRYISRRADTKEKVLEMCERRAQS